MSVYKSSAMTRELLQRLKIGTTGYDFKEFNTAEGEEILRIVSRTVQPVLEENDLTITAPANGVAEQAQLIVSAPASAAGVAEIDSFTITTPATSDDFVGITLNGVNFAVAIANGDTEIQVAGKIRAASYAGWSTGGTGATVTFTATTGGTRSAPAYDPQSSATTATVIVSQAGTNASNVKVTLDAVDFLIAVANGDSAITVAGKIRAASYAGWSTGGTGATVTFTAAATGPKADAAYDPLTTAAAGAMTTPIQGSSPSTVIVTLNGVAFPIAVVSGDSAIVIAGKIRAGTYAGWVVSGTGANAVFTAAVAGPRTDGAYNANGSGAIGTMTTPTQGVTAFDDVIMIKTTLSSNLGRIDGIDQPQHVFSPHDVLFVQRPSSAANIDWSMRYHCLGEASKCGARLWVYEKAIAATDQDVDLSGAVLITTVEADILDPLLGSQ